MYQKKKQTKQKTKPTEQKGPSSDNYYLRGPVKEFLKVNISSMNHHFWMLVKSFAGLNILGMTGIYWNHGYTGIQNTGVYVTFLIDQTSLCFVSFPYVKPYPVIISDF